jgi:hypothetical protein
MAEPMDVESDLDQSASLHAEEHSEANGVEQPEVGSGLAALPFSLLETIKTAQAEHGLRHSDFVRYR